MLWNFHSLIYIPSITTWDNFKKTWLGKHVHLNCELLTWKLLDKKFKNVHGFLYVMTEPDF